MPDLAALADAIARTLSPEITQRQAAEAFLREKSTTPAFSVSLLHLIALESAPQHVRQATAVYIKNHTINVYSDANWMQTPSTDRDSVKAAIVNIMLSVPVVVRRQLSEVLAIVAEHEYPATWSQLVQELASKLEAVYGPPSKAAPEQDITNLIDWVALEGVLETLYFIFERYPERMSSNEFFTEIIFSLEHTKERVMNLFGVMNRVIAADIDTKEEKLVSAVFTNVELLCKVFYCLSWQQLPEFFEDNLETFMTNLRSLLVFESTNIDALFDDEPSPVDKMHVVVLEITNHYAVHYDEEFRPYLQQFLRDTWALLVRRSNSPKYDGVVTAGIKFLTSISRSPDFKLFEDPAVLDQICKSIVVPNIALREDDEELFEDNQVEYVRRDMEGSDTDTRRRGSVELVKGLCMNYEKPVTDIFAAFIQEMLAPQSDWRKKDTVLYIITALGWKKGTLSGGATETSALINIVEFFNTFVMPQLSECSTNPVHLRTPIFTADVIKFVISFRNQIPKEDSGNVILVCVKLLTAKEPVVRTYAAACIERILTVKDKIVHSNGNGTTGVAPAATSVRRMTKADLQPVLQDMLLAVINALRDSTRPNEYIMRLVLRFCAVAQDTMGPYVEKLVPTLVEILSSVTANPSNPVFNHFLFETLCALIRFNGNSNTVGVFKGALVPPLCKILMDDVTEFMPYAFQVFSQLMTLHPGALPETYKNIMGPILTPTMWDNRGYVPGMVQFLDVYIRKNASDVIAAQQLEAVLGVFQKLIASKATDHYGLHLLNCVLESYDMNTMSKYLQSVFNILMVRLTMAKTGKFCSNMLVTLSIFVLRFGVITMKSNFDQLQPNMLVSLIQDVWLTEVMMIRKADDRRLCAIALTEIGCGGDDLCVNLPYLDLWGKIIEANVALTEGIVTHKGKKEEIAEATEEEAGHIGVGESYSGSYSQLKWANHNVPGVSELMGPKDGRVVFAEKLKELNSRHPGKFEGILQTQVDWRARQAIMSYMSLKSA